MRDRSLDYYARLFSTMVVLPQWVDALEWDVSLIRGSWNLYQGLVAPPPLVGAIHCLECGCDVTRQILNGERWNRRTTLVPAGLGPFGSWRESAQVALRRLRLCTLRDAEGWNGWGYAMRGVNSPYIWSGSNHGLGVGKFVFDGHYDPHAVSGQVGVALIIRALSQADGSVTRPESQ